MDPQFNQSPLNNPPTEPGPVVPPPPPAEVSVRTLQSDTASIQQQGGAMPTPEIIPQSGIENNAPVFNPETASVTPINSSSTKVWVALVVIVIIAGIAAGAGYYYYRSPNFQETAVTTPVEPPAPTPIPPATAVIDLTAVNEALKKEALQIQPSGSVLPVTLATEDKVPIPFSKFFFIMLPKLASDTAMVDLVTKTFSDSFTTYLYYDDNGVWPVYRTNIKTDAGVDALALRSSLTILEQSEIANFYINPPGTPNAFKDGQVNNLPTRYASFAQPGASFNYLLTNSDFFISTSYQALKSVLEKNP